MEFKEYQNVNLWDMNRDPRIENIFLKYFPKNRVSMGALIRKGPFLLMELAGATKDRWSMMSYIKEDTIYTYIGIFDHTDKELKSSNMQVGFTITNKPTTKYGKIHTYKLINSLFHKDKWIPKPVKQSKVLIRKPNGNFVYEKISSESTVSPYVLHVSPHPRLIEDIVHSWLWRICNFSASTSSSSIMDSYPLEIDYELVESSYVA